MLAISSLIIKILLYFNNNKAQNMFFSNIKSNMQRRNMKVYSDDCRKCWYGSSVFAPRLSQQLTDWVHNTQCEDDNTREANNI